MEGGLGISRSISEVTMGCVYKISCDYDERFYIGSTLCHGDKRWREHRYALRSNRHPSPYFQKLFNAYGEKSFKFHIVEDGLDGATVREREQYWIDSNSDFLLNSSKSATNPDRKGAKMPQAWLDAQSEKMKGNQYRKGKPHPDADRKKIGDGLRKAHAEGRRAPIDKNISVANLAAFNAAVKSGVLPPPAEKHERNALMVEHYRQTKDGATTAAAFGITPSTFYEIMRRIARNELQPRGGSNGRRGSDGRFHRKGSNDDSFSL